MLTEQEALACFNYLVNCEKAHRCICQHFANKPSSANGGFRTYGVTLLSMTKLAVAIAKSDWDTHFSAKEVQPLWRRHETSTYVEQIVDLCMENQERFQ